MALQRVTSEDFRTEVLESDVPVVVDFYADWCGPCHQVAPILEQLARQWGADVKVVKVDTPRWSGKWPPGTGSPPSPRFCCFATVRSRPGAWEPSQDM